MSTIARSAIVTDIRTTGTSTYRRNITALRNKTTQAFSKIRQKAQQAGKAMNGSLSGFKSILAGITVGAAVREVGKLIQLGDNIGKSAKRIGITAEEYQKLSFAARRAGTSSAAVETAMKRMAKTIYDADNGLETAARAFRKIGVSADELKGKNPHQQFVIISEALNRVKDASTKAALAQDLFGRAGTQIIPMIGDYQSLSDELERMNGIMSNESVAAAEAFQDSMENLSTSLQSTVMNSGLIEWLSDVVDRLDKAVQYAALVDKTGAKGRGAEQGITDDIVDTVTDGKMFGGGIMGTIAKYSPVGLAMQASRSFGWAGSGQGAGDEQLSLEAATPAEIKKAKKVRADSISAPGKTGRSTASTDKKISDYKKKLDTAARKMADASFRDSVGKRIDSWKKKIGQFQSKVEKTAKKLANFGGSLDSKLLKSDAQIKQAKKDTILRTKIEAHNSGEKVTFSREEQQRINTMETERRAALTARDGAANSKNAIGNEQTRMADRAKRQRNAANQANYAAANKNYQQAMPTTQSNADVVVALNGVKQVLMQRLPEAV